MKPLPIRLVPRHGEPVHGAVIRLAARHDLRFDSKFAKLIGINYKNFFYGHENQKVAILSGLDPTQVENFTGTHHEKKTAEINGEIVCRRDLSFKVRRVCLECIQADALAALKQSYDASDFVYSRTYWDVQSITACHKHLTLLVSSCPSCLSGLSWQDGSIRYCSMGCNLCAVHGPREPVPNIAMNQYFAGRLGFGDRYKNQTLDRMEYHNAVRFCRNLGRMKDVGWCQKLGREKRLSQLLIWQKSGFEMTRSLMTSVNRMLDTIFEQSKEHGKGRGVLQAYGCVYERWLRHKDVSYMAPLTEVVRQHALKNKIIHPNENMLTCRNNPTGGARITAIAKSFNMSYSKCKTLLMNAGLLTEAYRAGAYMPFDDERIIRYLTEFERDSIDVGAMAQLLGVSRVTVRKLANTGLIKRVGIKVSRKSGLELVAKLNDATRQYRKIPPPQTAKDLYWAGRRESLVSIIKRAIKGEIKLWQKAPSASLLHSLAVDTLDLKKKPRPKDIMTMLDAVKVFRVHPESMRTLVKNEVIKKEGTKGIKKAAVEKFAAKHITSAEYAAYFGVNHMTILAQFDRIKFKPIFGRPEYRTQIYRRSDAAKIFGPFQPVMQATWEARKPIF